MDDSLLFVASKGGVGLFPASVAESVVDPGIDFLPIVDPTPVVEILLCWDRHNLNPLVADFLGAAQGVTPTLPMRAP
jgi:DNA-binding transcriptional LysR family regulator